MPDDDNYNMFDPLAIAVFAVGYHRDFYGTPSGDLDVFWERNGHDVVVETHNAGIVEEGDGDVCDLCEGDADYVWQVYNKELLIWANCCRRCLPTKGDKNYIVVG